MACFVCRCAFGAFAPLCIVCRWESRVVKESTEIQVSGAYLLPCVLYSPGDLIS